MERLRDTQSRASVCRAISHDNHITPEMRAEEIMNVCLDMIAPTGEFKHGFKIVNKLRNDVVKILNSEGFETQFDFDTDKTTAAWITVSWK